MCRTQHFTFLQTSTAPIHMTRMKKSSISSSGSAPASKKMFKGSQIRENTYFHLLLKAQGSAITESQNLKEGRHHLGSMHLVALRMSEEIEQNS